MPTNVELITDLISKYLQNNLKHAERAQLQRWKRQSSANRRKFEELTNVDLLMEKITIYLSIKEEPAPHS